MVSSDEDAPRWCFCGCGCSFLLVVGLILLFVVIITLIADYFGPPEGIAADHKAKEITIKIALSLLAICFLAGVWLVAAWWRGD